MEREEFYNRCSEILDISHSYHQPVPKRTRWNNRFLGNGRFKGYGVIRYHSEVSIVVISKKGTRYFNNVDAVFRFIELSGGV